MAEPPPISAQTRLYCLLGDPVSHSKSPAMMNAAFRAARIDAVYLALRVGPGALGAVVDALREVGAGGVNVTAPHKETIIPFLDGLDDSARRSGSVNTVVPGQGGLIGHSTDGDGLVGALEDGLGVGIRGATIVMIGAGGAARGVLPALIHREPARIVLANRTAGKARHLVQDFGAAGTLTALPLESSDLTGAIAGADIVLNATALPVEDALSLGVDLSLAGRAALVFDMNYGKRPLESPPVPPGISARFSDGLPMLLYQGARSFALWTRQEPPLGVMRRALDG